MKKKVVLVPICSLKCIIKGCYFFFAAFIILSFIDLSFCPWTGSLNCASFVAGIVEAVLHGCNFVSIRVSSIYIRFQLFERWIRLNVYRNHQINYYHCYSLKYLQEACYKNLKQHYLAFICLCLSFIKKKLKQFSPTKLTNQSSQPNFRQILCHQYVNFFAEAQTSFLAKRP